MTANALTPAMRRAYEFCAETWGKDDGWLDVESRADSRYSIYQYNTGPGDLMEITDRDQPGLGVMEMDVARFDDPDFRLVDRFHVSANTDRSCVREGGFRDRRHYKIWEWSTIAWLRELANEQVTFENSVDIIIVQPSMRGYTLNIEGTGVYYEVTHAEVLGDVFNVGRVLNVMRAANNIDVNERPNMFMDTSLRRRQSIMLRATQLMAGTFKKRKRTSEAEGASSIEKTSM